MKKLSRRLACRLLGGIPFTRATFAGETAAQPRRYKTALSIDASEARLEIGDVSYRFRHSTAGWAFDSVWVRGQCVAMPLRPEDSFYAGSGRAESLAALRSDSGKHEMRAAWASGAAVFYSVDENDRLPRITQRFEGVSKPVCAWRTPAADTRQQGAWVTRGETASDAEGRKVFIDASGGLVFGHSIAGGDDTAYVLQPKLARNINPHGKTMQPTTTFFGSGRMLGAGGYFGYWQIEMGADQPKEFCIIFDRDLGGRLHHVCDRYYANAVDSQVDLASQPNNYDPYWALERMPLRLLCPESLIPHYGWHMEEYTRAAYPFGDDAGIQTAAFLAFEGHATGRDWEKYFGQYAMRQMPLWGKRDGEGFFTERDNGWTRWAYNSDYKTAFPFKEGGNWTDSEHIYHAAVLFGDNELKAKALGLMKHDVDVKLDLKNMTFPPCWNPLTGRLEDHRDDWETTAGIAYCAEIASEIIFRETGDSHYLDVANRITDWLAEQLWPEERMNWFHPGVNTYHCFMGPIVRSLVHRFERGDDRRFLEIAQDLAWVMILTLGTTADRDPAGRSFTGVTCVGVRGCVDYDCAPNLCHEKDLAFLDIAGALLPHVAGSGYAKILAMQRVVLPRDSWKDAFGIQEQRDVNLRTNYDNYARGMANLAFSLNRSRDPWVPAYELLAPVRSRDIQTRREIVLANGTPTDRETMVQIRFLKPGRYRVEVEGFASQSLGSAALESGFPARVPANSLLRIHVAAQGLDPQPAPRSNLDSTTTWLSDATPCAAQRGIGLPQPIFVKDRSFAGKPLRLGDQIYSNGLGLAANTVLLYALEGRYKRFAAAFGIDPDLAGSTPRPSVNLTIFIDGQCRFTSGPTLAETPLHEIDIDVAGGRMLAIRMSGDWDDNGDTRHDFANLADARLIGAAIP